MTIQSINLELPSTLYQQLVDVAEASHQSLTDVALQSIRMGLPEVARAAKSDIGRATRRVSQKSVTMKRLIVWGAGELGGRVAQRWVARGGVAIGLTLTEQRHAELQAVGVEPRIGSPIGLLEADDLLLLTIPGHARQHKAVEQLLAAQTPAVHRAVFISVNGYYGLPRPELTTINEDTPGGMDERAMSIAASEQAFRQWAGDSGVILRAGGLYCRGRGPLNAVARRGYPRPGPPNKSLALIHYDDIATAVLAALQHPQPEAVYNVVSPPTPTRQVLYTAICQKLNLPEPTFEAPLPCPPVVYDVTRLRRDLLPQPVYPHWQSALEA